MARINGEQVFKALYTGVNEMEQIRLQKFTVSTSTSQLDDTFETFEKSQKENNASVKLLFIDDCCALRDYFIQKIPSLKLPSTYPVGSCSETLIQYLELPEKMKESVQLIETVAVADILCGLILDDSQEQNEMIAGFDCEWTVEDGSRSKISLIQLAFSDMIYLFHIAKMSNFPRGLRLILESLKIKKVGKNIKSDMT
jgi:hypothetical protein